MEIRINKEINTYRETVIMGLTLRQLICSILAIGVAVGLHFLLKTLFGQESISWICIAGAAPFGLAGFFQYNGLTIEKLALAWFKTEILYAGRRVYRSENYYLKALQMSGKRKGKRHETKKNENS